MVAKNQDRKKLTNYEYNVVIDDYKLVYMPILKCAATAIKECLKTFIPRPKMRILTTEEVAAECTGDADYFIFTFVRHPHDRLVSLWHNLVVCPTEKGFHPGLAAHGIEHGMGFDEMVKVIAAVPDEIANNHFRQQVSCLTHDGAFLPEWVGRFERLAQDWAILSGTLRARGLDAPERLKRRNWTRKRHPWSRYYDDALYAIARDRYADDLEAFYT